MQTFEIECQGVLLLPYIMFTVMGHGISQHLISHAFNSKYTRRGNGQVLTERISVGGRAFFLPSDKAQCTMSKTPVFCVGEKKGISWMSLRLFWGKSGPFSSEQASESNQTQRTISK
jgi:hypothetical protein